MPRHDSTLHVVRSHHARDRLDEPVPATRFADELFASDRGERIEACAPVVLRRAPRSLDPSAVLEALEGRVQRSMVDEQRVAGSLLDDARDSLAVMRPEGEGAQDE